MSSNNIKNMSKQLKVPDYARLCGVAREAIWNRIRRGKMKPIAYKQPDGSEIYYIDIEQYPPEKWKRGRKKNKKN